MVTCHCACSKSSQGNAYESCDGKVFSADLKFSYKLQEFWQTKNLGHRLSKFDMLQSDTKVNLFHSVYFCLY